MITIFSQISLQSGNITEAVNLSPFNNSGSFILSNKPFYINTGNAPVIWTMPALSLTTGRTYQLKNRGGQITLTGNGGDAFFSNRSVLSFVLNSGDAYTVANSSYYWEIM